MKKIILLIILISLASINFCYGEETISKVQITLSTIIDNKPRIQWNGNINTFFSVLDNPRGTIGNHLYTTNNLPMYYIDKYVDQIPWPLSLQIGESYLIFVLDNQEREWKERIIRNPSESEYDAYYSALSSRAADIKNTVQILQNLVTTINKIYKNLEKIKNNLNNLGQFLAENNCSIKNPNDPTITTALENLNNSLISLNNNVLTEQKLFGLLQPQKCLNGIPGISKYNAICYYDFDDFSNKELLNKLNIDVSNNINRIYAAIRSIATKCNFWDSGGASITKITQDAAKNVGNLSITEYGGRIWTATTEIPIAVKPTGFFGKEFSEIGPEDIFKAVKDFLFKLAPYIFSILLIIGGLLYLFTPVSEQIKKGNEIIKWAVIGYFLLLVITGVVSLLKSILGGP
ncbi:MAG: hypothetical protein ACP5JU_00090 [Minisyncoccia bacterium]